MMMPRLWLLKDQQRTDQLGKIRDKGEINEETERTGMDGREVDRRKLLLEQCDRVEG